MPLGSCKTARTTPHSFGRKIIDARVISNCETRVSPVRFAFRRKGRGVGKTILVLGLSGVGKSWLCSRLASVREAVHVSASDLLSSAKAALSGEVPTAEQLRTGQVLDNQMLLTTAFSRMRAAETGLLLLDGHNVVDDGRTLVRVPFEDF